MDGNRFDQLTRLLGGERSRRTVIKELAAGLIASAGGVLSAGQAEARVQCRRNRQICRKGDDCCSKHCGPADSRGRRRCCGDSGNECHSDSQCCPGSVCCEGGFCNQCCSDEECAQPGDTYCRRTLCGLGGCVEQNIYYGLNLVEQTPGDCKRSICNGEGAVIDVVDDTDVPDDGNECTDNVCTEGTPSNPSKVAGTECAQNGGSVCDGAGNCVECIDSDDCVGDAEICCNNTCVNGNSNQTCGTCDNQCVSETCCSGVCVDLLDDSLNCGACDNVCLSPYDDCCNSACVDLDADEQNCGACGNSCDVGLTCCSGSCHDLDTDNQNCGACGNDCTLNDQMCSGEGYCVNCVQHSDCEGYCVDNVCVGCLPNDYDCTDPSECCNGGCDGTCFTP